MEKTIDPADFVQWSEYWAAGALTSLPQDFSGNYDGEVAEFWHQRFAEMPASARLLDVCCGNGPVALLAAEWAGRHDRLVEISAADAARPQPERVPGLSAQQREMLRHIRFWGETPIESLPFENESFDLVCSQYGLEYCDLTRAAPQLERVLRPGGVLAVVSHQADSAMMQTMLDELAAYDALDHTRIAKLMRSWSRGQLGEREFVRSAQQALRALQAARDESSRSPLVRQVARSLAGLLQLQPVEMRQQRGAVAHYADQLQAGRARLDDMLRVNQRIADNPRWHAPLEATGLVMHSGHDLMYAGEHSMGRCLVWIKPA